MRLTDPWDAFLQLVLPRRRFVLLRDRCEICRGAKGGVRGEEIELSPGVRVCCRCAEEFFDWMHPQ